MKAAAPITRKLRCAVYTRKSTEEGLEQEFNSLDAQREACEAYVASQRAEGWILVPDRYDDGGVSGATLERPALRRLLADIEANRVDVVVVYKIDRLSRSLLDFAKLVDIFDRKSVTFVSVTQAFNTTTSMGRLTLNILLSFAQFEREVIGERIRDKFAASRRKGMWMGGWAPLGYNIKDRKLVVNGPEAELVRSIFRRFARGTPPQQLIKQLAKEGTLNKQGKAAELDTAARIDASRQIGKINRELGSTGADLAYLILVAKWDLKTYASSIGENVTDEKRVVRYWGRRFRECLDCIARVAGIKARPNRRLVPRDRFAEMDDPHNDNDALYTAIHRAKVTPR
jgi:DNA invertase Pin-like site-specific DNA recombinase